MFYLISTYCCISCYTSQNCLSDKLQGCPKLQTGGTPCQKFHGKVQYARDSQNKSEKEVPFACQVPGCTIFTWLLIWEILGFSNLYPANLPLQRKVPIGHGQLFSSFPYLSHFPRATGTKFKLKRPEKGRAVLLSSSLALVPWHNLCTGTDFPAWLRTEAVRANVSQAHTWIFLLAKMWPKNITWGPANTDGAVCVINTGRRGLCGQLLPKKLLLCKIQAEVTRKAVPQHCFKSGCQDREENKLCYSARTGTQKFHCKILKSGFITPPPSHWHC